MFSVVMTWIPSARMSWTSWYRLGFRFPGTLVCASSSMRATWGFRARTASRSISSRTTPRYSWRRRGTTSRPSISFAVSARPWVSTSPTTTSIPASLRRCLSRSIWYVFPTPAPYPRYTFSRPRPARRINRRKVSARSSGIAITFQRPSCPSPFLHGIVPGPPQGEMERASRPFPAIHPHGSAVRLHDVLYDGQAQPDSRPRTLIGHAKELFEDAGKIVLRDPHPGVGNLKPDELPFPLRGEGDLAAGRCVLQGVREQVGEDVGDPGRIHQNRRQGRGQVDDQGHTPVPGRGTVRLHLPGHQTGRAG